MYCLAGVLYVAGRQTKYSDSGSGATNEVYRFDPWSCRWSRVRSVPPRFSVLFAAFVKMSIVVLELIHRRGVERQRTAPQFVL